MAVLGRLVRTSPAWAWRIIAPSKTLTPSRPPSGDLCRRLYHRNFEHQILPNASECQRPRSVLEASRLYSLFPAVVAGLFGVGLLDVAYSDADEHSAGATKPAMPSESPSNYVDLEEIARKERKRIEDMLRSKGMQYGSYPRFTVAVKGQKVTIKFQIPPRCEIPHLIANLVSQLGLKAEERGGAADMLLRAWDSAVAWQLTLNRQGKKKETGGDQDRSEETNGHEGDLCVLIFRSLISSDKAEIEFMKQGSLSPKELDALVSVLEIAGGRLGQSKTLDRRQREGNARLPSAERSVSSLESMGVRIYGLDESLVNSSSREISWDTIAGYDKQKGVRDGENRTVPKRDEAARGTRGGTASPLIKPRAAQPQPANSGKISNFGLLNKNNDRRIKTDEILQNPMLLGPTKTPDIPRKDR